MWCQSMAAQVQPIPAVKMHWTRKQKNAEENHQLTKKNENDQVTFGYRKTPQQAKKRLSGQL